jgi:hypothetical protein
MIRRVRNLKTAYFRPRRTKLRSRYASASAKLSQEQRYAFRVAAARLRLPPPRFTLARGSRAGRCGRLPPAAREIEISSKSTAARSSVRLRSRASNIASASRTTSSALPYPPFCIARRINCSWSRFKRTSMRSSLGASNSGVKYMFHFLNRLHLCITNPTRPKTSHRYIPEPGARRAKARRLHLLAKFPET